MDAVVDVDGLDVERHQLADIEDDDDDDDDTTFQYEQAISPNQLGVTSWSRSSLAIAYEPTGSVLAEPSPRTVPSLTAEQSDEVLTNFLTNEAGNCIEPEPKEDEDDPQTVQPDANPPPFGRTTTIQSTTSHWTVSKVTGKTMKLDQLVKLIRAQPSLQGAEILSTEGYKQRHNGVLHRFLILELQREDKPSDWLRIDRRADPDTNRISLLLAAGESPAHDTAIFSANKKDLIEGAHFESRQRFDTTTTLSELGYLLQVICEELTVYQIWPANCWFLVSLLQQHLQGDEIGCFVDRSPKWGQVARSVRYRVKERLRLIYHIPLPFSAEDILLSVETILDPGLQSLMAKALSRRQWMTSHDLQNVSASSNSGAQLAQVLDQIANGLHHSGLDLKAIWIRQRAIDISRELCRRDPGRNRRKLAFYLHGLGDLLAGLGRSQVALRLLREAASMWQPRHSGERKRTRLMVVLQRCGSVFKTAARVSISALSRKIYAGAGAAKAATKSLSPYQEMGAHIAGSLSKLAIKFHNAEQIQDACSADEKELLIVRNLFAFDPDGHRAALSATLHSAWVSLCAAGHIDRAWCCEKEAITLRRELFRADPDSHRVILAHYLNSLGVALHSTQRFEDACAAQGEAVALQRDVIGINPDSHHVALAQYLHNLGASLHGVRRFEDACAAKNEAIALQRELALVDPNSHRATLAEYLTSFSASLHEAQRLRDACEVAAEAVALQRELFQADPDIHRAVLADYLDSLGVSLHEAERFDEALVAKAEAAALQRELFQVDPSSHRAVLAGYLSSLGVTLHEVRRCSDACTVAEEAVAHQQELFRADPDSHRAALTKYLNTVEIISTKLRAFTVRVP